MKEEKVTGIIGIFFAILLIIYSISPTGFTLNGLLILHLILLILGLIICFLIIGKVTKSSNSLKSKIYFSFIFSFLIFFLITFFWWLGDTIFTIGDEFGISTMLIELSCVLAFAISFIRGIVLSVKRKQRKDFEYNIKSFLFIITILSIILVVLLSYNPVVSKIGLSLGSPSICKMSISLPSSVMFSSGSEEFCLRWVASGNLDDTICDKINDASQRSACYYNIASKKGDVNVCFNGLKRGAQRMAVCVYEVADNLNNSELCEYLAEGKNYVQGLDLPLTKENMLPGGMTVRDYCIFQIVLHTQNITLCNSINGYESKKDCFQLFSGI